MRRRATFAALTLAGLGGCASCTKASAKKKAGEDAAPRLLTTAPKEAGPAARPGMILIPSGTLRAGTPAGQVPRIADEEMEGVPLEMDAFYIDVLPYPNEPGAIPTSNVTQKEAADLCAQKGKRLCTELEWERACKGSESTAYEYGDQYRASVCGTGLAPEEAARRPTGELAACKSTFGVADMHGGVWEWTDSSWGRSSPNASMGVLRGGNAAQGAGELVARCANGIARATTKRAPTMGLRCCAGPKNDDEVKLDLVGTPGLSGVQNDIAEAWTNDVVATFGTRDAAEPPPVNLRGFSWTPVANEPLAIVFGCSARTPRRCALVVGSKVGGRSTVLARTTVGTVLPELARVGDARHLRIRSLDTLGTFSREITYAYGRVDIGTVKRP